MQMLKLSDVLAKVKTYNPAADIDLITKAYVFSSKVHDGQMRLSGQPFVVHPLEVANILADMKLDAASIVAGILHDTIEDTTATKERIDELFGSDIADLVDGVTKLSKLHFNTREERQAENFRKMIIAMSKDIRVILIKLADRLHNLKTLQFMPEEKQVAIAQETLDIYAPLASRLGIQWLKVLLEDLSFRFLKADIYKQLEKKISRLRKNREHYIERVCKAIADHFGSAIPGMTIVGRMKHVFGIYRKMERQNISFEQVHDIIAFRLLTKTVEQCYEALGHLHSMWKPIPGRFKDYIAMPKPNNYRSLHTSVVCLDAERVEFQIRTHEMHEISEKGIAAHWRYKENGKLDMQSSATFNWLRQLMDWQKELNDSLEFMDTVKLDLFSSELYVFTPKGDVRVLPRGSTPLDFAYSIHSDIGNHCSGAKINQRIVPLSTQLQSGDEVEILTNPQRNPTKDWLKMVGSSRAIAKIRQYLKEEQRDKSVVLGQSIFDQECVRCGLKPEEVLKRDELWNYLKNRGLANETGFYKALAYGKISLRSLFEQIQPDRKEENLPEEGFLRKIFKKVSQRNKNQVLISGLDEILVNYAKCCLPVRGDPIIGFVTRGRGVTIHRTECPKVPDIDPERRVNATWNTKVDLVRRAKLRIVTENKPGMLAAIAQKISEKKINISKVLVRTTRDVKAIISMDIDVSDVHELFSIVKAVEGINGVITVTREMG